MTGTLALKEQVNAALVRATGYRLQKATTTPAAPKRRKGGARPGDRLLTSPAFVLSSVRSGSTLLRVLLNSHSQIHAPIELHLRDLKTDVGSKYAERSLKEIGLAGDALQYLLWDRVLHRELSSTGKRQLVNKTPNDVFIADRIRACWPDAKFIFLLRHPVATAASRQKARPQDSEERNTEMILRYGNALEQARTTFEGLTVRYEELTEDPERVTREVCAFLGLSWEQRMLEYGEFDHGRFKPGLGDWSEKITSGEVQAPTPPPADDEIPEALVPYAREWGYLGAAVS